MTLSSDPHAIRVKTSAGWQEVTSGGAFSLTWQPFALTNGWRDYATLHPADGYPSPRFAIVGGLCFLTGVVDGVNQTGPLILPAPAAKQRIHVDVPAGSANYDVGPDGALRLPSGVAVVDTFVVFNCFYPLS